MKKTPSKSKKKAKKSVSESKLDDEPDVSGDALDNIQWECICLTMDDWNSFAEKEKKSRKKQDQELYAYLEENFLNDLPALFSKAVSFYF